VTGVKNRWRWVLPAGLVGLVALALLASPAGGAKKKPKRLPDLVVKHAELDAPVDRYAFANERPRIVFSDRTKNMGTATAIPSRNRFYLGRTLKGPYLLGPWRNVPELLPHESNKGSGETNANLKAWPYEDIGAYHPSVCADTRPRRVRERNEKNNCFEMKKRFSVIPRTWTGTVDGTAHPYNESGITETWGGDVTYTFDRPAADTGGAFFYRLEDATLTYSISGADSQGCTYSGGPAILYLHGAEPGSMLFLDTTIPMYSASGTLGSSGLHYTITVHCPGDPHPSTQNGPIIHDEDFLFSAAGLNRIKPKFGFRSLKGNWTSTTNWPITYTYDLHAE